jgi:hypothetical protein
VATDCRTGSKVGSIIEAAVGDLIDRGSIRLGWMVADAEGEEVEPRAVVRN